MRKSKKIIALLLAIVTIFSVVSISASALVLPGELAKHAVMKNSLAKMKSPRLLILDGLQEASEAYLVGTTHWNPAQYAAAEVLYKTSTPVKAGAPVYLASIATALLPMLFAIFQ